MRPQAFLLFLNSLSVFGENQYILLGKTEEGKSSFINWLAGLNVTKEGFLNSTTSKAEIFPITVFGKTYDFMDTPGLHDTRGLTDEQILNHIQIEALSKEKEGKQVGGILIIIDGTQTRIYIKKLIFSALQMFGENSKSSILVCINKNESLMADQRALLRTNISQTLTELGMSPNQLIFLDTKNNSEVYLSPLFESLEKLKPVEFNFIKRLEEKIEEYYQIELNDDSNYNIKITKIPHSVCETKYETIYLDEPYAYECNCQRRCSSRVFGVCVNHKTTCGTCYSTRKVPRTISKNICTTEYIVTTERTLKNEEAHLRTIARNKVIGELKATVFKTENSAKMERMSCGSESMNCKSDK